jgi:hypothetical protein
VLSNVTLPVQFVPEIIIRFALHRMQPLRESVMQKQVIKFAGEPVGIVIPDEDRLKFIAVKFHVIDLDEQRFDSADDVRAAISKLVASRNSAPVAHV